MNPFRLAKRALTRRGWCKGYLHDRRKRSCLLGAFQSQGDSLSVYGLLGGRRPEWLQLRDIVLEKFPDRLGVDRFNDCAVTPDSTNWSIVACFNNHRKTTLADVNKVLEIAARRWAAARRAKTTNTGRTK